MRIEFYESAAAFLKDTEDRLRHTEAQNNLILANALKGRAEEETAFGWLMASVKDNKGGILVIAMCTPPFNLIVYEEGNKPQPEALEGLMAAIRDKGFPLPGIIAERDTARRSAQAYSRAIGGIAYEIGLSMNVMTAMEIGPLPDTPGQCRLATKADLFFIPYWERAFGQEAGVDYAGIPVHGERFLKRLATKNQYLWEDGIPVSQCVHGRSTVTGAVITAVYTPPFYRGKGYASACVGYVSQKLLEAGNRFCCLFADANNPVSNKIYRRIGYKDLCVYDTLAFVPHPPDGEEK